MSRSQTETSVGERNLKIPDSRVCVKSAEHGTVNTQSRETRSKSCFSWPWPVTFY